MADYTEDIPIPDHKRGDKWPGMTIGPITINDGAPPATLARFRMHFRKGSSVYRIDTDATLRNAPATISNAANWSVSVPEIKTGFLPSAGTWEWDAEFFQTGDDAPLTLYKGTLTVHPDVTR